MLPLLDGFRSRETLDAGMVRTLLSYDPASGIFRWNEYRSQRARPGMVAGGIKGHGYRRIEINQISYAAHRLAWLYVHGRWPDQYIDHINGVRTDNRIANLRVVSASQNAIYGLRRRGQKTARPAYSECVGAT